MKQVNNKTEGRLIPNNVIRIKSKLDTSFFKYWFHFLKAFHHLTNREIDVVACIVKERYLLSKVISDSNVLDSVLLSEKIKGKVKAECGITGSHFQAVLSHLRKKNVLVDGRINPKFLPNIREENGSFKLLIVFDIDDEQANL